MGAASEGAIGMEAGGAGTETRRKYHGGAQTRMTRNERKKLAKRKKKAGDGRRTSKPPG